LGGEVASLVALDPPAFLWQIARIAQFSGDT
jgi:hypothetical protein